MLAISSGSGLKPAAQCSGGTQKLLSRRVPKGIPDALRGAAWCGLSGAQALMDARPGVYARLKLEAADKDALPEVVASQIELAQSLLPSHLLVSAHASSMLPHSSPPQSTSSRSR